jgi:hypothetical protein
LSLFLGEALRLRGRVVSKASDFGDFGVCDRLGRFTVGTLVDGDDGRTAKSEVLLEGVPGLFVLDKAVVGPASEVPDQFGTLSKASCSCNSFVSMSSR